jgi:hypothetical protein
MASGANGMAIDDLNGDNFDHGGLGFFGGAWIFASPPSGRPIASRLTPAGTPRWGLGWKEATARWYNHSFTVNASGASYAHRENYLDLDPNYRDAIGRPLVRMTYNFHDNDRRLSAHMVEVAGKNRQGDDADPDGSSALCAREFQHRALSVDPQYRRHHHGDRSQPERREPLPTMLGRRQSVRDGRLGVSTKRRGSANRDGRRARLLGRRRHHDALPETAGATGSRLAAPDPPLRVPGFCPTITPQ